MAQRGCRISILRNFWSIWIWAGKIPEKPDLISPALSKDWPRWLPEISSNMNDSVFLWVSGCNNWTRRRWGIRWGTGGGCGWIFWSESRGVPWNDQMAWALLLGRKAEREFRFFDLEKRRLHGDFIAAFQYLRKACKKAGEELFIWAFIGQGEKALNWEKVDWD